MADALSEDEFATWEPFAAGYDRIGRKLEFSDARDEIRQRLADGDLRAAARKTINGSGRNEVTLERTILVPSLWGQAEDVSEYSNIWTTSSHTFLIRRHQGPSARVACTGLRLDPSGLNLILEDAGVGTPVAPAPVAPPTRTRGARRKDWWDHLWIEMVRRIRAGTLKPKGPAELERTMLDWLAEKEIYPGEDTLKKTASNLFKYLEE